MTLYFQKSPCNTPFTGAIFYEILKCCKSTWFVLFQANSVLVFVFSKEEKKDYASYKINDCSKTLNVYGPFLRLIQANIRIALDGKVDDDIKEYKTAI